MATTIPINHAAFTVDEILQATSGSLLARGAAGAVGVSSDTRTIEPGSAFVALVGARHDGHQHAAAAAERGASVLLVSRPVEAPAGVAVVRVDDTLMALGALGRAHRRRWQAQAPGRGPVVAITGSAGKTTTRVAVAAALSACGLDVHASHGNLNNAVGIPMVLLGLEDHHQAAVCEVGTSSPGEIGHGGSLVEHEIGVLTLVAAAHTELLRSVDDVAHEKGHIFSTMRPGGAAVANADDHRAVAQLARAPSPRVFTYGEAAAADVRIVERAPLGLDRSRLRLSLAPRLEGPAEIEIETPLIGVAGAYACAAALAVVAGAGALPAHAAAVARALGQIEGEGGRLRVLRRPDGLVIIDDSYNANRASVVASLRTAAELARAEGRRLVAVLGEMRELGALSAAEHRAVGDEAAALGALVIAVQGDAREIARSAARPGGPEVLFVDDAARAVDAASARLNAGDLLLVKGSRGVGLDAVVNALTPGPL